MFITPRVHYTLYMKVFKPIFWLFALLFGVFLDAYVYSCSVFRKKTAKSEIKKENSNKMLFIGCGGFVE